MGAIYAGCDSILIPVDAHPELFGVEARKKAGSTRFMKRVI